MTTKNILNPNGHKLVDGTYYSVQHGLILCVAYYSGDVWYPTGEMAFKTSELSDDFIVIDPICHQNDLLKK